jgi:hypothetical protein
VRCLDSGTAANRALRRRGTRASCGGCGRLVGTEVDPADVNKTVVLVRHGSREPCPRCGSRDPAHHARDHDQETTR